MKNFKRVKIKNVKENFMNGHSSRRKKKPV